MVTKVLSANLNVTHIYHLNLSQCISLSRDKISTGKHYTKSNLLDIKFITPVLRFFIYVHINNTAT